VVGNTIALFLSAYLIDTSFTFSSIIDDPVMALRYDWKVIRMDYQYLIGSNSQYLFALIVFCYSALSLKRNFLSRKVTAPGGIEGKVM
jgi:hypothetical protein